MATIIIMLVALVASLLTFVSGFGLSTLLTPVFVVFFPIEIAIAMTAIVHFFNNIFKFTLFYNHIDFRIVRKFGIPSVIGAIIGASLLLFTRQLPIVCSYHLFEKTYAIEWMNLVVGILMIGFAILEFLPNKKLQLNENQLITGG